MLGKAIFASVHICSTRSVTDRMEESVGFRLWVLECLDRHFSGDFGNICDEDRAINRENLKSKNMIMSVYHNKEQKETIWIITDAGWEVTTVLYPSEY